MPHITPVRHGDFDENGQFPQIEVSSCLTSLTIPHPIRDQFIQASVTVPTPINYREYTDYFLQAHMRSSNALLTLPHSLQKQDGLLGIFITHTNHHSPHSM